MEHPVIVDDEGEVSTKESLTQQFRRKLAASMAQPIRRSLDYQGIARRALVVDQLPQGALPTYDKDIDVSKLVCSFAHDTLRVNDEGEPGTKYEFQVRLTAGRVTIPTFEIASNPTIRISDVKRRRFNIIDRSSK